MLFALLIIPLTIIAMDDNETMEIPVKWIMLAALFSLVHIFTAPFYLSFIVSSVIACFCFMLLRIGCKLFLGQESMGIGDIILSVILGLWLLPEQVGLFMATSGLLGLIFATITKKSRIPFAPSMIIAFYFTKIVSSLDLLN